MIWTELLNFFSMDHVRLWDCGKRTGHKARKSCIQVMSLTHKMTEYMNEVFINLLLCAELVMYPDK